MAAPISFVAIGEDQSWSYFIWGLLGGEDVHMQCCADPEMGIQRVIETRALIVSIDLAMTSLDGTAVLERIFQESLATQAVILAGYPAGESAILARRARRSSFTSRTVFLKDLRWELWPLLRHARTMGVD